MSKLAGQGLPRRNSNPHEHKDPAISAPRPPHQFRTRNKPIEMQRTQSKSNDRVARSTGQTLVRLPNIKPAFTRLTRT
jgi:hypothetical protein